MTIENISVGILIVAAMSLTFTPLYRELSLTRFPGQTHSAGEEPAYDVPWEENADHSARSSSEKRSVA